MSILRLKIVVKRSTKLSPDQAAQADIEYVVYAKGINALIGYMHQAPDLLMIYSHCWSIKSCFHKNVTFVLHESDHMYVYSFRLRRYEALSR